MLRVLNKIKIKRQKKSNQNYHSNNLNSSNYGRKIRNNLKIIKNNP